MRLELLDGQRIFVIHDLLTPQECAALIARSESIGFEAADVGGELLPQLRTNGRALLEDETLAADLWQRSSEYIPPILEGAMAAGLHPRFRFYRYEIAEQFGIHMDGSVSSGKAQSKLTFMVYLSHVEQGGETNFYRTGRVLEFTVQPAPGKALIFEHRRWHEGAAVHAGRKYVLRTDVLFLPPVPK